MLLPAHPPRLIRGLMAAITSSSDPCMMCCLVLLLALTRERYASACSFCKHAKEAVQFLDLPNPSPATQPRFAANDSSHTLDNGSVASLFSSGLIASAVSCKLCLNMQMPEVTTGASAL
jgi:hypothetical protein